MKKDKKTLKIAEVAPLVEAVPPNSQNGLEFVVSWITDGLVDAGHEVTLFATENSRTKAKVFPIMEVNSHAKGDPYSPIITAWNAIMAVLKQDNFDIIHCHSREGAVIAPFLKIPLVQTIHHPFEKDDLFLFRHDSKDREKMKPVLEYYNKINHVFVSRYQESCFIEGVGEYVQNHTHIPNGIPVKNFSFNEKPKDYLLYIGYINENKGADIAVQVARKLDMNLIIAGNNFGEEKFFEEKIKPFLSEKIIYVGPVGFAEKNELYRNALVKLAPLKWHEPFGLTLVESMACGTPVIAFSKGAAPEIISNGETGFLVNSFQEMLSAVGKIKKINRNKCRKRAVELFDVNKMVSSYENLFYKLIKN